MKHTTNMFAHEGHSSDRQKIQGGEVGRGHGVEDVRLQYRVKGPDLRDSQAADTDLLPQEEEKAVGSS